MHQHEGPNRTTCTHTHKKNSAICYSAYSHPAFHTPPLCHPVATYSTIGAKLESSLQIVKGPKSYGVCEEFTFLSKLDKSVRRARQPGRLGKGFVSEAWDHQDPRPAVQAVETCPFLVLYHVRPQKHLSKAQFCTKLYI